MAVELAQNAAGDYAIGATIDGTFVPFATVAGHRVAHLQQRAENLAERAKDSGHEGHGAALDAIDADFQIVKTSSKTSSKTKAEGEGA